METTTIIWDLGGVLIDWNPEYLFEKLIKEEHQRKFFFEKICTSEWNEEQDAGRSIKEATESLAAQYPEWKEMIEAYYGRWTEMLGGPIQGTVDVFDALRQTGRFKFYALTNWSAELFPIALDRYHFLHWFDGRLVSGEEKMRKPFPEFYQLLLNRFNLQPETCLFIDDNERNIKAAEAAGIPSLRYTSPQNLRSDLEKRNLLH